MLKRKQQLSRSAGEVMIVWLWYWIRQRGQGTRSTLFTLTEYLYIILTYCLRLRLEYLIIWNYFLSKLLYVFSRVTDTIVLSSVLSESWTWNSVEQHSLSMITFCKSKWIVCMKRGTLANASFPWRISPLTEVLRFKRSKRGESRLDPVVNDHLLNCISYRSQPLDVASQATTFLHQPVPTLWVWVRVRAISL